VLRDGARTYIPPRPPVALEAGTIQPQAHRPRPRGEIGIRDPRRERKPDRRAGRIERVRQDDNVPNEVGIEAQPPRPRLMQELAGLAAAQRNFGADLGRLEATLARYENRGEEQGRMVGSHPVQVVD
jgi:hypothetical protein